MPGHERRLKRTVRLDIARNLQRSIGKNWKRIEEQKEFFRKWNKRRYLRAGIAGCL